MISGDIMPTSMDKDQIFIEIRNTVMFLLRERAQGREQFDIADLFRRDLEDEIVNNFDNMIKRQEYENIILQLFEQKKQKRKSIPQGRVQRETEKLIRQYRMRSKKQILKKLISQFNPDPDDFPQIKEYVTEVYNKLMRDPVQRRITGLVKDGTKDPRRVLSVLRREGYELDRKIIIEILTQAIQKEVKSPGTHLRRGRIAGKRVSSPLKTSDTPVNKRIRGQMQKSLLRKARYKKQKFIRKECPRINFKLTENTVEGDSRTLIYLGIRDDSEITVKTLLTTNKITDVVINCSKKKLKRGAEISIGEFLNNVANGKGDIFLQHWLKRTNKQLSFSNIQELIWFMMSILNDRFGLSEGLSKYLKDRFVKHLINLDKSLTNYVIEKTLESM